MFEKDSRLGGHTHTHTLELEKEVRVDSGFIVMNDRNYPLLTKLFLELEIELHPTSMSFSVDTENISWCSEEFKKFRFFNSLKKIRIFLEMVRFNNIATNIDSNGTIEDWLKERKFSEFFKKNTSLVILCVPPEYGSTQTLLSHLTYENNSSSKVPISKYELNFFISIIS